MAVHSLTLVTREPVCSLGLGKKFDFGVRNRKLGRAFLLSTGNTPSINRSGVVIEPITRFRFSIVIVGGSARSFGLLFGIVVVLIIAKQKHSSEVGEPPVSPLNSIVFNHPPFFLPLLLPLPLFTILPPSSSSAPYILPRLQSSRSYFRVSRER
jgi:hypothetical protein